jgi:hypothetical protein
MFLIASSRHATACFNKHGDTTDVAHERSDPPIASKKKSGESKAIPLSSGGFNTSRFLADRLVFY